MKTLDKIKNHVLPNGVADFIAYDKSIDVVDSYTPTVGVVLPDVGTEYVVLESEYYKLMTCVSKLIENTQVYCIVEKNCKARKATDYIDSDRNRIIVVSEQVFVVITGIMYDLIKRNQALSKALDDVTEDRDIYKDMFNTLRANGVIE